MARKKNTVKSAPNSLRQALLAVKTAILNFSPEHILSLSYDPSSKAMTVKDIPANLESQFTLGESSGGDSAVFKKLTIVNNRSGNATTSGVTVSDGFAKTVDDDLHIGCKVPNIKGGTSATINIPFSANYLEDFEYPAECYLVLKSSNGAAITVTGSNNVELAASGSQSATRNFFILTLKSTLQDNETITIADA